MIYRGTFEKRRLLGNAPQSEYSLHSSIIRMAHQHPILFKYLIHIPNGGRRDKPEAMKLKCMGVKKGVSDLFLAYPNNTYHGMWQELKSKKGCLSIEQKEWLMRMRNVGYAAEIAKQESQSIDFFIDYIQNRYIPTKLFD